jgi:hypothetical protein
MRRNRTLQTLVVLTLITLPVLAVGGAVPETGKTPAEALAQLLEPPAQTLCVTTECIDVIVFAHNPETGECREFPNPCSIPPGWVRGCP